MTDQELMRRLAGNLTKTVFIPGRVGIGSGPDPGMVVPQDDPQTIATTLAQARANFESGGGRNPFLGAVVGDSLGGAQGALLNLRAQNIAMAEAAQRRQDQINQANLDRQLKAQIAEATNRLAGTELLNTLLNSQSNRQNAALRNELDRLQTLGNIQTRMVDYGARYAPVDTSKIDKLLPYGAELAKQTQDVGSQIGELKRMLQTRGQQAAQQYRLEPGVDANGFPVFSMIDENMDDPAGAYWNAVNSTYQIPASGNAPARDLGDELKALLQREQALKAGQAAYKADLDREMAMRKDRGALQIPEAQQRALLEIMQQLQQLQPQAAPTAAALPQSLAQRLIPGASVLAPTGRLPAPPQPKRWSFRNGAVTRS